MDSLRVALPRKKGGSYFRSNVVPQREWGASSRALPDAVAFPSKQSRALPAPHAPVVT